VRSDGGGGGSGRDSIARRIRFASSIARAPAANVVRGVLFRPWRAWNSLAHIYTLLGRNAGLRTTSLIGPRFYVSLAGW
jgi:hypothetical protein